MLLVYMLMKMDIIFNVWSGIFFFSFFLFMITNCCLLKLVYEESDFKLIFKIVHLLVFIESEFKQFIDLTVTVTVNSDNALIVS